MVLKYGDSSQRDDEKLFSQTMVAKAVGKFGHVMVVLEGEQRSHGQISFGKVFVGEVGERRAVVVNPSMVRI